MAKGKIIIEGAKAFCSSAQVIKNKGTAVPIKVTSQKNKLGKNKYFAQDKPIATYLDDKAENFNNGQGFVMCQDPKNNSTGYSPCKAKCNIKYKDYYENVDFNKSMKVLLDVSTGTCPGYGVPGTIQFADSGQKGSVSQIDVNEADAFAIANTSAIWETASSSSTKTSVSNIEIIKPFREKPKGTKNTYYFIKEPEPLQMFWQNNIQNDSMIHLEACASGDASKISWVLFKGTGIKDKIKTFIGLGTTFNCNLNTLFKDLEEGKYRIEAYGRKPGDEKCAIIIEYVKDHIKGITVAGKSTVKNITVPINISFKADSFSNFSKILNNNKLVDTSPVVSWRVLKEGAVLYNSHSTKDTSLLNVRIANESVRTTPVAIMTFKNAGKYTIEAYTDVQGTNRHTVSIEVKDSYGVNSISHKGSGLLRYNDMLSVSVAKYSVELLPTNAKVQWYLQKDGVRLQQFETAAIAKKPNINKRIDEIVNIDAKAGNNYFGKYVIEAYGKALEAGKSPSFKGADAFSFEVIKNAADKISLPSHVPKGSKVKYEANARIMPLSNNEQLTLQLPEGVTNNNDGSLTFTKNGEFKIEAALEGAYTTATKVSTSVKVTTPLLKRALWSYKTGYKRTETGFKEESYGFVEIEGLSNVSLKAKIWLKGDYDTYLAEPEKYMLEEKTLALNDQGKGYFKIATNDEYKKKMEAAIPATTENPTPTYSLIFTIELPENSSGATTLAENLEITHANLIVGTKMYSVLEPNEVLQVTNEQKVKSIVFATEDGKNVQQTLTYYGKTHKIWAHTVNMIDEELKIDVLREVPKENMNEDAAGIIVTHEAIETYNAEKVGPDGLLEVSFTLNEDCKIEGQTYDYYIAQVSKKVKDAADPSKESYQLLKSQVIVNDSLPASLTHDTEMEKMGIKAKKADGTPFTPEEMLTLRKKFINYEQGALKVAHTQATPEAVQNNNVFVEIESAEIEEQEKKKLCPNCDKDITLEEIKSICVDSNDKCLIENTDMITSALPYLNKYRKKIGINTCVRKAHFLAQISQETKFYMLQEGFIYRDSERMRGIFNSYFSTFGTLAEQQAEAKRLSDLSLDSSNAQEVANAIYGSTHIYGKEHTEANDGWRYSGKGFKQITWKDNYRKIQNYFNKNMKIDNEPDVIWLDNDNPYKLKENPKDAITSALAFWGMKNINAVTNGSTDDNVENVTRIINSKKEGLKERQRYFKKAINILKVNDCKPGLNLATNITQTYDKKHKADSKTAFINVIVPKDRKYQGLLVFFDNTGTLFSSYVLAYGTGSDKLKAEGNGATPNGLWSTWYTKTHIGETSYGNHGLIHMTGIEGDALTATNKGRAGIAIHAGHTVGYGDFINDKGHLMVTFGCLRVYNADIETLVKKYSHYKETKEIKVYVEEVDDINKVYEFYDIERDPKEPKIKEKNKQKTQ
ncbi:PAAR-like protein [Flavobacterium sp. 316]|uniref:PAAR-like protein n=1 Tax=Flavobacterium sp. 316 TaxID=1603293 RepID=UPI00069804CD|nr:PAAR-like protein [Flavobacterium sp. 316]